MLLVSPIKDEDGGFHALNRWEERIGLPAKLFLQILAECNLYLPDDWRLVSSSAEWQVTREVANRFRIDVRLAEPAAAAALVGRSHRVGKTEIVHLINTVVNVHDFSSQILKDYCQEHNVTFDRIDQKVKDELQEILTPNLYYFSPCPEDSPSPLFARQYERVKYLDKMKVGAQYHRLHALTRDGVDADHFRWVFWNTDGDVRPVAFPADDFRGKSYWGIRTLGESVQAGERSSSDVNFYKKTYAKMLTDNGVVVAKPEHTPYSLYEVEFKFSLDGVDRDAFSATQGKVLQVITGSGFSVSSANSRSMNDTYMDDENRSLLKCGASFRLRRQSDNVRVTLKKRFPEEASGLYKRIEEEVVISKSQEKELRAGKPISALPYRLLAYVAPGYEKLTPVLEVKNVRVVHTISDKSQRHAELCFDEVTFIVGNRQVGPFYEIELESKGIASDELARLASLLDALDGLGLTRSSESKYAHAVTVLSKC